MVAIVSYGCRRQLWLPSSVMVAVVGYGCRRRLRLPSVALRPRKRSHGFPRRLLLRVLRDALCSSGDGLGYWFFESIEGGRLRDGVDKGASIAETSRYLPDRLEFCQGIW